MTESRLTFISLKVSSSYIYLIIWISNILTGYSRNASCTLNLMCMVIFRIFLIVYSLRTNVVLIL